VSDVKKGLNWNKKDILIEDIETPAKIYISLWNKDVAKIQAKDIGSVVVLKNFEVHEWNKRKSLKSTSVTKVEVCSQLK
jgi:hypothetical protein